MLKLIPLYEKNYPHGDDAIPRGLLRTADAKDSVIPRRKSRPISSNVDLVKLVVIRPYNYLYFGHAVEIFVNHVSQVSLPNQSYSILTAQPGEIEVRGQSGLLGPPSREIRIKGEKGDVIYLLWHTDSEPNYTSIVPIIILNWLRITKEEANIYLKDVEFKNPKNIS